MTAALLACVAPRDDATEQPCSSNAQCPADGKHVCDLIAAKCVVCTTTTCPTAVASSTDTSTTNATDTQDTGATEGTDTGATEATDTGATEATDTNTVGSCANHCNNTDKAPGSDPVCYCDTSCIGFGDCCPDRAKFCGNTSDAASTTDAEDEDAEANTSDANTSDANTVDAGTSDSVDASSDATVVTK